MGSYSKNKITGKWFCSDCGKEIPIEEIIKPYNYFNNDETEHTCSD